MQTLVTPDVNQAELAEQELPPGPYRITFQTEDPLSQADLNQIREAILSAGIALTHLTQTNRRPNLVIIDAVKHSSGPIGQYPEFSSPFGPTFPADQSLLELNPLLFTDTPDEDVPVGIGPAGLSIGSLDMGPNPLADPLLAINPEDVPVSIGPSLYEQLGVGSIGQELPGMEPNPLTNPLLSMSEQQDAPIGIGPLGLQSIGSIGQWQAIIPLIVPILIVGASVWGVTQLPTITSSLTNLLIPVSLVLVGGMVLALLVGKEPISAVVKKYA